MHIGAAERGSRQVGVSDRLGVEDTTWINGGIQMLMGLGDRHVGLLDKEAYRN